MIKETKQHLFFRDKLLEWYTENMREFPWKKNNDPYKIWLSEIILQQTRIEQGLPYYNRISSKYPTVFQLAKVDDDEFMNDWQGLGYYSRARNMLSTARWIVDNNGGEFPTEFEGLLKLKGVGRYTASAIASFAYDKPHAVVDGNVIRVIARFMGIDEPIDQTFTLKLIHQLADIMLNRKQPGIYNQAIMDFGATQCTPKKTDCEICPLNIQCIAYNSNLVNYLPYKSKKIKRRSRYFHFILIKNNNDEYLIEKRIQSDIWQNLYQFPMVESDDEAITTKLLYQKFYEKYNISLQESLLIHTSKQQLTHQNILGRFYKVNNSDMTDVNSALDKLKICKDLSSIALPKILSAFVIKFNI